MISIVIPTYNPPNTDKVHAYLLPCLQSVYKYTDVDRFEIILVCNGCSEETKGGLDFIGADGYINFSKIWIDAPIGFSKAVNLGIRASYGEHIVLLNDDTQLLPQPKNQWLDMLLNQNADVTGPLENKIPGTNINFIVGFCMMINRRCLLEIGGLDEKFDVGGFEDADYCLRAISAGFKVERTGKITGATADGELIVGDFPIYHAAEKTVHTIPNWNDIFYGNLQKLKEKHKL